MYVSGAVYCGGLGMWMHKDFALVEVSLKTAVNVCFFCVMSCWQQGFQLVLLEKVIHRPSSMLELWWPWSSQLRLAYLVSHSNLQTYPFSLSDCQMWFTAHMSHICRLSYLKGSVNDVNVSRGECRVTSVGFLPHLEVPAIQVICRCCFCSLDLLQSVKNWCQHRSKAKCLFYTECRSSHNLLINQAAKETDIMCLSSCSCVSVCTCVAKPHPGGGYSAIFERDL